MKEPVTIIGPQTVSQMGCCGNRCAYRKSYLTLGSYLYSSLLLALEKQPKIPIRSEAEVVCRETSGAGERSEQPASGDDVVRCQSLYFRT